MSETTWYIGTMNDGLFIINTKPRPAPVDYPVHDRKDGPTLVIPVSSLGSERANEIVAAHNATISAQSAQIEALIVAALPKDETIATQSALLAQMAAALAEVGKSLPESSINGRLIASTLAAYAASSPDPQWQRVPEGCVVVPRHCTVEMGLAFRMQAEGWVNGSEMQTRVAINAAIARGQRARGEN